MKTIALTASVIFCTVAAIFSFYAASIITHGAGWQMVQAGVLFMGICYAIAAIVILEVAGRRLRRNS